MTEELYEGPDAPAVAADPAGPDPAAGTLAPEIEALKGERDEYHDRLLRTAAEFENYRKRAERDRRELAEQATGDVLLELLALADDFDLALSVEPGSSPDAYRKGVELIRTKLHDLLRRHQVHPIEAVGRDFDPNVHQAVVHEPTASHRDGEVMEELRRGYMRGDRLLRPALVKVAKA
jgi:molecular chaperone GrpE